MAVRLDAMFEAVKLPARVTDLTSCLADVDGDALTHDDWVGVELGKGRQKGL